MGCLFNVKVRYSRNGQVLFIINQRAEPQPQNKRGKLTYIYALTRLKHCFNLCYI